MGKLVGFLVIPALSQKGGFTSVSVSVVNSQFRGSQVFAYA